jgi:hypothetical protein
MAPSVIPYRGLDVSHLGEYTLCRSAWWREGSRHGRLTVVLLLLVWLHGPAGTAAKQCTRFRPSGCHFTTRHNETVLYPACKSACHFEVRSRVIVHKVGISLARSTRFIHAAQLLATPITQVEQDLQCPFHSAGVFLTEEAAECTDPFMEGPMQRPRRLPDCSHHCCRAQETVGAALTNQSLHQTHH